jgi:uncharacterized protein Yka (UPF0111/DUF47 family)
MRPPAGLWRRVPHLPVRRGGIRCRSAGRSTTRTGNGVFLGAAAEEGGDDRHRRGERHRHCGRRGQETPSTQRDLNLLLDEMRLVKDEGELATMRRAAAISAGAHVRAMRFCADRFRSGAASIPEYEIEAELLMYLQRSDRSFLGAVADHARVAAEMVEWIRHAIGQLKHHERLDGARGAARLKSWKTDAAGIIERTRRAVDTVEHGAKLRRLLSEGDKVVKGLEEAAFILTLVPGGIDAGIADLLDQLADLSSHAVHEYVRCLEAAGDLSRGAARPDLERFLVTVDRLVTLEDGCDEAERAIRERVLRDPSPDFRQAYVLSELTRRLHLATDSVVQSGLLVRDYVLSIAPGA